MVDQPTESSWLLPDHPDETSGRGAVAGERLSQVVKPIGLAAVLLSLLFLIHSVHEGPSLSDHAPSGLISGRYYEFSDMSSGLFVRVDERSNGALTFSETIPWLTGSNLKAVIFSSTCLKLQSMRGRWVRNVDGVIRADGVMEAQGDCIMLTTDGSDGTKMVIESAKSRLYAALSASELFIGGLFDIGMIATDSEDAATVFRIEQYEPIKGVNLGGWFIPEYWMMPGFYANSGLKGNASLCNFVKMNRTLADERITHNIRTWITETDIAQIAALGLNSVRLPIGYWNVIEDPYRLFVPVNISISLSALDWCFDICMKYNISVVIDLHGAPGSQNGLDHSGCQMNVEWTEKRNIELSLNAVEAIMLRYADQANFLGIEVLNEPSYQIEQTNHTLLLGYYDHAYRVVRRYSNKALFIFNDLYSDFFGLWVSELREPKYYNVVLDLHLYDWQEPYTFESAEQHIADALEWKSVIGNLSVCHPVIVGEWSYSTGKNNIIYLLHIE